MRHVLIEHLNERGDKSRLAEACGVKPPTVTKWIEGHIAIDPKHWGKIEDHFGLPGGTMSRAAGITQPPPADVVARLQGEIDELRRRLDDVTQRLAAQATELDAPAPPPAPASAQRPRQGSRGRKGADRA